MVGAGQYPNNGGLLGRWGCNQTSSLVAPKSGFESKQTIPNTIFNNWFWPAAPTPQPDKILKWYTGGSWKQGRMKRWTGTAWVGAVVKRWTGSTWEVID